MQAHDLSLPSYRQPIDQHRFVFLCGLHRSGTSPLFKVLRDHPRISGFRDTGVPEDEGQHLQTVIPAARAFGGPGHFGFAVEAHLTEQSHLVSLANTERLFEEWAKHWNLQREYLLEKSPPNLIRTRFLQALFPRSYFIVIFRHPIAVALATLKWTRTRLESLMEHWLHCHRIFYSDRPYLNRVLTVKYEDLIRDGAQTLQLIYDFLGIPGCNALPLDPNGNERYFEAWRHFSRSKNGQVVFRDLVRRYETAIQAYGYSLLNC